MVAILVVTFSFFLGGSKSVYGDRLDDIDKYPITDNVKNTYIKNLEDDQIVKDVKFDVKGRIIYVIIDFNDDVSLSDAENRAAASLTDIGDDLMSYYDVSLTLRSDATANSDGFTILGARNASGNGLNWNNNTPVESE